VDQGRLPIDVCERLGRIIVELVINASKYAFADRKNGVVRIDMIRSVRNWRCIVSDNGMDGADRSTGTMSFQKGFLCKIQVQNPGLPLSSG
jgi:two-component sensor histidine kinase